MTPELMAREFIDDPMRFLDLDEQMDVCRALVAVTARIAESAPLVCRWTPPSAEDDDIDAWRTGCGHAWQFIDGGPAENQQRFCGYCGGALVEVVVGVETLHDPQAIRAAMEDTLPCATCAGTGTAGERKSDGAPLVCTECQR